MENQPAPPKKLLKTCPRCGETLLAEGGFYKSGASCDGFTSCCRECIKREMRERAAAKTPEQRHEKNQHDYQRRRLNPEQRAKHAAAQLEWQRNNKEHLREYRSRYRRVWKATNPEQHRIGNQISNNRARAKKLGVPNTFQMSDWLRTLEHFGNACAFCSADGALLEVEHLDAMGTGGANAPGNVVPACRPCNANKWRKTMEQFCVERRLDAAVIRTRAAQLVDSVPLN